MEDRGAEAVTAQPDPQYDVLSALQQFGPGVVLTEAVYGGLVAAYAAGGFVSLDQAQVLAVTGPLPPYPTELPRFPDSNPQPRDG